MAAACSHVLDGGDEGPDVSLVSRLLGSREYNGGVQDGHGHARVGIILASVNWLTIKSLTEETDNHGTIRRRFHLACKNIVVNNCVLVCARTSRATSKPCRYDCWSSYH